MPRSGYGSTYQLFHVVWPQCRLWRMYIHIFFGKNISQLCPWSTVCRPSTYYDNSRRRLFWFIGYGLSRMLVFSFLDLGENSENIALRTVISSPYWSDLRNVLMNIWCINHVHPLNECHNSIVSTIRIIVFLHNYRFPCSNNTFEYLILYKLFCLGQ